MAVRSRVPQRLWLHCFLFVACLVAAPIAGGHVIHGKTNDLVKFFKEIDRDGDGEIQHYEAAASAGLFQVLPDGANPHSDGEETTTSDPSTLQVADLDFSYGGSTICAAELVEHLGNMLTGEQVVEWVKHGLRLPQYAEAFQRNAIVGLDFPTLISDDSRSLSEDLGVQSSLHQKKIHQSIMRQIFGLGRPPGPPRALECKATPCGSIQLQWDPPVIVGVPPVHKYLVQRRPMSTRSAAWVEVGDPNEDALLDNGNLSPGVPYIYRVQAWGGHGSSEWVTVEGCLTLTALVKDCTLEGWDFENADIQAITSSLLGTQVSGEGREQKGEKTKATHKSHFWSYMYSVNGGLVMIGVLARFSFFSKMAFTLLGFLQANVVRKLKLKYALSKASPYFAVRMFARFVEAVVYCVVWVQATAKRAVESLLRAGHLGGRTEVGVGSREGGGRRWWEHDLSTPAEYTWDEMMAAVSKTVMSKTKDMGGTGSIEHAEMRLTKSEPMLSRSSSEASKSSADGLWPSTCTSSSNGGGKGNSSTSGSGKEEWWKQEGIRSLDGKNLSAEDLRILGAIAVSSQDAETTVGGREELMRRLMLISRKSSGLRSGGDRSSHSGSESEDMEDEEEKDANQFEHSNHGSELRRESSESSNGSQKGRFRCNAEGCPVRFDRWHSVTDWRANLSKHYCRDCQGVYCIKHTRISPHGSRGQCGLDSKCICYSCFARLPANVQANLERQNKLRAGPPVGTVSSSASAADEHGSGQKFKVTGAVVGWLTGHDHETQKNAASMSHSVSLDEEGRGATKNGAAKTGVLRQRSRSRSPLREAVGSEVKVVRSVSAGQSSNRKKSFGGFPESLGLGSLSANSRGSNTETTDLMDSEDHDSDSVRASGFAFRPSGLRDLERHASAQLKTEMDEGTDEQRLPFFSLGGSTIDNSDRGRANKQKSELWKVGSGPLRPVSTEYSPNDNNNKLEKYLSSPLNGWGGGKSPRAASKSPIKTRGIFGLGGSSVGKEQKEPNVEVSRGAESDAALKKHSASGPPILVDAIHPTFESRSTSSEEFHGFHGPTLSEQGVSPAPLPSPPSETIALRGSSSLDSVDDELSKIASELRWRMCTMYALRNRGSMSQESISGSAEGDSHRGSPGSSNTIGSGGKASMGGMARGASVKGREGGGAPTEGGRGTEWGKGKPPRPPPTDAQRRWLKAGIWAIGKELERRKSFTEQTSGGETSEKLGKRGSSKSHG